MPIDTPPPPPPAVQQATPNTKRGTAPIADMRERFQRKSTPSPDDEARARVFIDGKIEMIRNDPQMTEADKAAAIADLEKRR